MTFTCLALCQSMLEGTFGIVQENEGFYLLCIIKLTKVEKLKKVNYMQAFFIYL